MSKQEATRLADALENLKRNSFGQVQDMPVYEAAALLRQWPEAGEPVAVEKLRLAGLALIGLSEHDQHCEVFDLDDDGRHKACTCGLDDSIAVITQAGKIAPPAESERIAALEEDLSFVERWANHHAAKPHMTAEQALSVIQHYPAIKAITKRYKDGKVPDTPDPWAALEQARVALEEIAWSNDNAWRTERAMQAAIALRAIKGVQR